MQRKLDHVLADEGIIAMQPAQPHVVVEGVEVVLPAPAVLGRGRALRLSPGRARHLNRWDPKLKI